MGVTFMFVGIVIYTLASGGTITITLTDGTTYENRDTCAAVGLSLFPTITESAMRGRLAPPGYAVTTYRVRVMCREVHTV